MPVKPTSERLRNEAEKLRETAVDLRQHAAVLIERSVELEKRILNRGSSKPKPNKNGH
jgi:hypothetical protein